MPLALLSLVLLFRPWMGDGGPCHAPMGHLPRRDSACNMHACHLPQFYVWGGLHHAACTVFRIKPCTDAPLATAPGWQARAVAAANTPLASPCPHLLVFAARAQQFIHQCLLYTVHAPVPAVYSPFSSACCIPLSPRPVSRKQAHVEGRVASWFVCAGVRHVCTHIPQQRPATLPPPQPEVHSIPISSADSVVTKKGHQTGSKWLCFLARGFLKRVSL